MHVAWALMGPEVSFAVSVLLSHLVASIVGQEKTLQFSFSKCGPT